MSAEDRTTAFSTTGPGAPPPESTIALSGPASALVAPPAFPRIPDYEILEQIGRGGMGIVYKAKHLPLNRIVALKMVALRNPELLSRFHREAEAIASLQHPNIVQIFEVGDFEGQPFLSLQFVQGGDLAQSIDGTPQPPREAARLVELLARAMCAAHQKGVIHRDLKPQNVLLTDDGAPKITDFGLAKQIDNEDETTQAGDILGTPSYMAPEQAEGRVKDIGPRTDIYALGAILYEMLIGRVPFKGSSKLETMSLVRTQEPVPPRHLQPRVPRDLETICLKCLEKEPARRYQSAEALAADLASFQAGTPIRSRPGRLRHWIQRRPALAALISLTVVMTVFLLGLSIWAKLQIEWAHQEADQTKRLLVEQTDLTEKALAREKKAKQHAAEALQKLANIPKAVVPPPPPKTLPPAMPAPTKPAASGPFLSRSGKLSETDSFDTAKRTHLQVFLTKLEAGRNYTIDLRSDKFDAYLILEDTSGKLLDQDDDGGGDAVNTLNARIIFQPTATANYRVIATSFKAGETGSFVLAISPPPVDSILYLEKSPPNLVKANPPPLDAAKISPAFSAHCLGLIGAPVRFDLLGAAAVFYARDFLTAEQKLAVSPVQRLMTDASDLTQQNRPADAEKSYRMALALLDSLLAQQPANVSHREYQARAYGGLADLLETQRPGDKDAEKFAWRALASWDELVTRDPANAVFRVEKSSALSSLGSTLAKQKKLEGARIFCQQAVQQQLQARNLAPNNLTYLQILGERYHGLANILVQLNEYQATQQTVAELLKQAPKEWDQAAVYLGRCMRSAQKDNRPEMVQQLGNLAVSSFERALDLGFRDYFAVWFDKDFEPLQQRADFQKIYRDRLKVDWNTIKIVRGKLAPEDPFDKKHTGSRCKVLMQKLAAGKKYRIDLVSQDFDVALRIEDAAMKHLAEDTDGAGNTSARLLFTPTVTDTYRIIATSVEAGKTGAYILGVQEVAP